MDGLEFLVTGAFEVFGFIFESVGHLFEIVAHGSEVVVSVVENIPVIDMLDVAVNVVDPLLDISSNNIQENQQNYNQYRNLR